MNTAREWAVLDHLVFLVQHLKMATGGNVPGSGNTDKVPALLTPGEFVVNKSQANKHRGFLNALNNGGVKGFAKGGSVGGSGDRLSRVGYSGATAGQIAALDKALSRRHQHRERCPSRLATASLEASAKAGQSAGVAIRKL